MNGAIGVQQPRAKYDSPENHKRREQQDEDQSQNQEKGFPGFIFDPEHNVCGFFLIMFLMWLQVLDFLGAEMREARINSCIPL
jgi:hypothetical protein